MSLRLLLILSFLFAISCDLRGDEEEIDLTFLDINNETIWQSTEEFYEDNYVGFSNNIQVALLYLINVDDEYGFCLRFKIGENKIPGAECNWENGETTQTYSIVINTKNQLVLDVNYYDDSCDSPFSIDYRYSYSIDDDFLYETIELAGQETSFREYSKSSFMFDNLCN
ncbi:MAG: hypothetical protein ACPH4N_07245 [Flavobacteriaceae bacterium]